MSVFANFLKNVEAIGEEGADKAMALLISDLVRELKQRRQDRLTNQILINLQEQVIDLLIFEVNQWAEPTDHLLSKLFRILSIWWWLSFLD